MFGNLFEDDGDSFEVSGSQAAQVRDAAPPPPRNRTGLAGIYNQGSTCFLNAALQVLALTPEFRSKLFQLTQAELGRLEDRAHDKQVREIPLELQRLCARLMLEQQLAVSSKDVTDSFGWTSEEVRYQQDAHELYQCLLNAIEQSLKGTSGQSLIADLFHGKSVNKIECSVCRHCSEREVEYCDLFVQVEGFVGGLLDSLHCAYCMPELMNDANKYRCDTCNGHVDAVRTTKLRSLPPILKISLVRFSYDPKTMKRYKVTDRFPFPVDIDMAPYTEHGQSGEATLYELYAVIIHGGSCDGGHYTTCIRDINDLGYWDDPDSGTVQVTAGPTSVVECNSPQQLVSLILSSQPDHSMSVDKLTADILKKTGVSWAKSYKGRHGSFQKFIKDHPDLFRFDENKMVTLLTPSDSRDRDRTQCPKSSNNANTNCSLGQRGVTSPPHSSLSEQQEKPVLPGQNWFFFNDARVSSMHAKDLKNEYAGKSSAYLLFYRQKCISRPPDARGNPMYRIPDYLLEEVAQINQALDRDRAEYEAKEAERREEEERRLLEVQVEIRFQWTHTLDKGVLTSQDEQIRITCPRLDTFGQLRETIITLGGSALGPDFRVHRMKCWKGKSHLYDELVDREKTLAQLAVDNGTILFVWDGQKVDGQVIPTGPDSEPITLHLKQYCSVLEVEHNFPKNMPLREFYHQVSTLTSIPLEKLQLRFEEDASIHTETSGEQTTLESVCLKDGSCVLYDSSDRPSFKTDINSPGAALHNPDTSPSATQSGDQFCVRIENRCHQQENTHKWPVLELEVDKDMTVGEVKQLFMTTYSISCDLPALRENDSLQGLQPPYEEDITVGNAGITEKTRLVLESLQMTLTFKVSCTSEEGVRQMSQASDEEVMQVTVHKMCSVQECLETMVQVAGVGDPVNWHLRKTNFFGEAVGILDDMSSCLYQCAVNPGDCVILQEGRLPPKGFVSIAVWLCPSPNQLHLPSPPGAMPRIEDLVIDSMVKEHNGPEYIGKVEIHGDSRLEDLRTEVQQLLVTKKQVQVKVTQLRLSIMDTKSKRLRRVLRGSLTTLRRLKVTSGGAVGIQIVGQHAEPSVDQVVLTLRVRSGEGGDYGLAQELVWDSSHGVTVSHLKEAVARSLLVSPHCLTLAKHFSDDFLWKVLTDQSPGHGEVQEQGEGQHESNKRKVKRRKGQARKPSVRLAPYHIQDGDVIGVIDSSCLVGDSRLSPPSPQDFDTQDDVVGRQNRQQRLLEREQARQLVDGLCGPGNTRRTVPLRIKIGDFT